jgi:hypothetical protein
MARTRGVWIAIVEKSPYHSEPRLRTAWVPRYPIAGTYGLMACRLPSLLVRVSEVSPPSALKTK